jgi:Uncharacterized conserved protein
MEHKEAGGRQIAEIQQEYEKKREERKTAGQRILDYVIITIASAVYAVGVSLFIDPNNMAPGGVTGLSIILSRIVPLGTGTLIMVLNIPIIMLGIWKFGLRFIISTFYTIVMTSFFTNVFAGFGVATDDILLAALAGSVLIAASIGVIFKRGATTGGTDIIVKCLRLKYPHLKTGMLFFMIDVCIVTLSGIVFRNIDSALYAGISVVVTAVVLDLVLYGRDGAKLVYIISDCQTKITDRLLAELDIGVTRLSGEGAFSGNEKKIIMCVVHKPLAPKVEEIVKEEDADAFMIVTSATEIFGEGYKSYYGEKF